MKKHLIVLVMVLLSKVASAFPVTFSLDGINYNLTTDDGYNAVVTGGSSCPGNLVIPSSIFYKEQEFRVTSIDSYAFRNVPFAHDLTSVIIPNSVTDIGDAAFQNCTNLTSITIPEGVTSIGRYTFQNCTSLTSITIPKSVTFIGSYAFANCTNLSSLVFTSSSISIDSNAFNGTEWYKNQPDGVVYIGNVAYKYKGTMPENTSITLKEGTIAIADYAFSDSKNLVNIAIPASVSTIGSSAFRGCIGLTSITIPEGVTSIGGAAFARIENLKSITIPSTVREIGSGAFYYSRNIENVYISDIDAWCRIRFGHDMVNYDLSNQGSSPVCGHLLLNGKEVTEVIFPEGITSISPYALSGCRNITSITIPNSVVDIGLYAFSGCSSITSVVIPCGVYLIPYGAFNGCKLENFVLRGSNTISSGTATYANFTQATCNHAVLYVPIGSKWDMIYENGWWPFINIREMADEKEELSDVKAYTLMNTKTMGYVVYDEVNDNTRSTSDVDENVANNSWQIIDANGNKCLYNIGAKKFASIKSDGNIALSEKPVALSMENGKDGIIIDNNSSSEWNFVLNEKINIDEHVTGIESITTSDSPANVYYDLNGRKLDGVPAQKGVYIQNGKKVVIK